MKKLLLYFFIVMSGAMTATTIKNRDAGPTSVSLTTVNSACGNPDGSVTIGSVTGGVAPYQYNFNNAGYVSSTVYSGLVAGTYTLDVKDSNGDIYTTSVTITDSPGPTAIANTTMNTTCGVPNGSVTLGAVTGGTPPYTYDFNITGTYSSTTSFTGLAAGSYGINVKDANGCIFTTTVNITNSGGPTAIATSVVNATCGASDGSITLGVVTGGTAPYIYQFDNSGGYTGITSYTGLIAGSYDINVKDANGCIFTTSATVTGSSPITTTISCGVSTTTSVQFNWNAVVGATGYTVSYTISPSGTPLTPTPIGSVTTYSVTGLNTGDSVTFTVTPTGGAGTCFASSTQSCIANNCTPPTMPTIASVTQPTCAVPSGTIVFNAQSGVEYSIGGSYQPSPTFSGLAPGTYTLTVRDTTNNTCITNAPSTLTINAIPSAPATPTTASVTQPTCAVPTGTVVITAQAGVEYSINGATFQASRTFSGLPPGTYTILVRNVADNTCSATGASTVTINAVPSPPATPVATVTQPTCATPTGTIVINAQAGVEYTINGGASYQASNTFVGLMSGVYTIRIRSNLDNTCQTSGSSVTINSAPSAPTAVAATIANAGCGASDGSVTITGVTNGTAPYSYNFNNIGFSGTTFYSALAAGTYPIIVKDANGCTFTMSVTVNNSGGPTAVATTTVDSNCGASNGSITIGTVTGGTPGYTYNFDSLGFSSTTNYTGLAAGSYPLVVKDANGCVYNTAVTVSNNGGPTGLASTTVNANCGNANGSITLGAVTGGTAPYQFEFNSGGYGTTITFSGLAAGSYPVNVKDANGCVFSTSVSIIDNPGPTNIATTVVDASCGNSNGSVTLGVVTGGTAPYTYGLDGSGFSSTTVYYNLSIGTYSIYVKDANGCIFTTSATILNNNTPGTAAINYSGSSFSSSDTSLQYVTLTGTGPYNGGTYTSTAGLFIYPANGTIVPSNSTPGCYTVTYTVPASGGCTVVTATTSVCIINAPDGIKLNAFIDANSNGVKDGAEQNYNGGQFHYELNNDGTIHNIYSSYGTYSIYDSNATNSYDVSFTTDNPNYTVNPSSYSNITVANGSGITTYNFPITSVGYTDLKVFISPYSGPGPGFTYYNYVYVQNIGNLTTPAGTLTFTKDNRLTITNVSPSASMTATGFTYNYPSLVPNQYVWLSVTLQTPTIPTVQLGDLITNTASIDIPAGDVYPSNNNYSFTQEVKGSYDPNDKNESHGPQIVHSTFTSTDYLNYTIQFENTGTGNALTVKVDDMLDAKLDETSIKMINASHNYTLDRVGNDLTWTFSGIDLVPTGKGYINFQVKPKPGYAVGDIINNTAYIYFDFNPAIITNTFSTEFVSVLGVAGFVNSQFSAYPNPTTGLITIALKNSAGIIDTITVTDVLGKTVQSNTVKNANTTVDLSNLTKGLYFVKIQAEGQVKTLKVVKE